MNGGCASKLTVIITLAFVGVAANATVIVDNFTPRDLSQNRRIGGTLGYGVHSFVDSFGGDMVGGERDIEIRTLSSSGSSAITALAEFGVSDGEETFNLGVLGRTGSAGDAGRATLQWDGVGDEVGNTGLDKELNNVGAGQPLFAINTGGFRVFYRSPELLTSVNTRVGMTLRANGQVLQESFFGEILEPGNHTIDFVFSEQAVLSADSLTFSVQAGSNNGRPVWLGLQRIEGIVPEPTGFLALGTGVLLFLKRSRLRKHMASDKAS